jgi:hypothetical protein
MPGSLWFSSSCPLPASIRADLDLLAVEAVLLLQLLAAQEGLVHPGLREVQRHLCRGPLGLLRLQLLQDMPLTRELVQQLHQQPNHQRSSHCFSRREHKDQAKRGPGLGRQMRIVLRLASV